MISLTFLVAVTVASVAGKAVKSDVDNSNLIAVRQVFRHGDRTPTAFYPNDPYSDPSYWPVPLGQLTNEGKQRHYHLGEFTRQRYAGFLPTAFNVDDFYAQTTDVDRTHMSAQSDIAGIFPPEGDQVWKSDLKWQPIPIHPAPENVISTAPNCVSYYKEWATTIAEGTFLPSEYNYTELYDYLTEHSGMSVSNIATLSTISDALFIEDLNGFTLPDWTQEIYPSPIREIGHYMFLSFAYTDNQKRLTSGGFLNDIIGDFEKIWEDKTSSPKYKIYSGHDTNIASILNTIGAFKIHSPAYAATLYFELRNVSGVPTVNIWHKNGDDFEQINEMNCALDCPLTDFKSNVSPWTVDADEWTELCSQTSTEYTVTSTALPEDVAQAEADITTHTNNKYGNKHNNNGHKKKNK